MLCEAAAYFNEQGKTLIDVLYDLYAEHGYFLDSLDNFMFKGIDGKDKMAKLLNDLREAPPAVVGNIAVKKVEDYLSDDMKNEGFPSSNVLKFILEDGSWVAVRPSGTEPKCKFYFSVVADNAEKAKKKLAIMKDVFEAGCK